MLDTKLITGVSPTYIPCLSRLIESCCYQSFPLEVLPITDTGKWDQNILQKIELIKFSLSGLKERESLLWIDCDGKFLKDPNLFSIRGYDLAAYKYPNHLGKNFSTCFLYLKNTPIIHYLCDVWYNRYETMINKDHFIVDDEHAFKEAFDEVNNSKVGPLKVLPLDERYRRLWDGTEAPEDTIIEFKSSSHLHHYNMRP